jgi:hypothetical protein
LFKSFNTRTNLHLNNSDQSEGSASTCEATAQSPDLSEVCGTTAVGLGALNHPKSMTMISSSGVTGATASVISSTSATNSPYSTSKSSSGAASTVTGTTHVVFSDSAGGDAANSSAAPSGESGERYTKSTVTQRCV